MRNSILTIVVSLFFTISACSQSTPKPPSTPLTGTSYSIDFDYDDDGTNSSVTIKKNENVYKLTASFDKHRTDEIKKILIKKLGRKNLKITGSKYTWIKNENGEEAFECKLSKGKLRFFVDKEYASEKFVAKMSDFGVVLKDAISGSDSEKEEKKRAEADLKRAQKDLERAKRNLDRVKRKLKDS